MRVNWQSILKKEWTEGDYEHPVVKELFRLMKNKEKEMVYRRYSEGQYKALKFFETNCSKYDISLFSYWHPYIDLKIILPNGTGLTCPTITSYTMEEFDYTTPEIIASIFLKDGGSPVCVRTPPHPRKLPFYDYVTTMVDVAANRGRGMNIDGMDVANKWVEKGITWGRGNYDASDGRVLYTPLDESHAVFYQVVDKYYDDPLKRKFIVETLLPYGKKVMDIFREEEERVEASREFSRKLEEMRNREGEGEQ